MGIFLSKILFRPGVLKCQKAYIEEFGVELISSFSAEDTIYEGIPWEHGYPQPNTGRNVCLSKLQRFSRQDLNPHKSEMKS